MDKEIDEINSIVFNFLKPILGDKETVWRLMNKCILYANNLHSTYCGEELLKILEGEAVYYEEFSYQLASEIASFICVTGNYDNTLLPIQSDILIRTKFDESVRESTECQLIYIRGNCASCSFHYRHRSYNDLRNHRIERPLDEYSIYVTNKIYRTKFGNEIMKIVFQEVLSSTSYLQQRPNSEKSNVRDLFFGQTTIQAELMMNSYIRFDIVCDFP